MKQEFYESLPIYASADIVVCGGGTAGAFAAIAAAREGMDVLLVEQYGSLGGSATNGLVTPVMSSHIPDGKTCSYLSNELRDRLFARGACSPNGREFDPTQLKIELESMATEAGVKFLYHTFIPDVLMNGAALDSLIIANKAGLSRIQGKIFIDCTGDGDVCVRSGAKYNKGNPETGINQPMSLRYIVDGIDVDELAQFFESVKAETGVEKACGTSNNGNSIYAHCCLGNPVTLTPIFEKAVENGDLTVDDHIYWQIFSMPGRRGSIACNCPEFFQNIDGTSPEDLTISQLKGKKAILRQLAFYKKYFKGFENAYIAEIASMVGIRESREIVCDYVMTPEDLLKKLKHPDMICQSNYPIDIHGKQLRNIHNNFIPDDERPWYDIPFRSLIVKDIDNLLVAGRCLGAEFLVESSLRVMHSARATGEAAGIGASFAILQNKNIHDIDGANVRNRMIEKGAEFC